MAIRSSEQLPAWHSSCSVISLCSSMVGMGVRVFLLGAYFVCNAKPGGSPPNPEPYLPGECSLLNTVAKVPGAAQRPANMLFLAQQS